MVKRYKTASSRVPTELYEKFQLKCENCGKSSNQALKEFIESVVNGEQKQETKRDTARTDSRIDQESREDSREQPITVEFINDID